MNHLTDIYHGKKVLITGGAGFIGSHLAERCVELGARVTILDNFSTGTFDNISPFANIIIYREGDIRNRTTCIEAARHHDIIFHLAAATSVPASFEHYADYYQTNIQGTLNMLVAAAEAMVQQFIFASSAAVYGHYEGICTETTDCQPTSPYGFSKYMGEHLCQQFARFHHITAICLRYFNVYGPRQRGDLPYAGVIARFTHCLQHNLPFTLYGTGEQQRDFVSVHEVVMANLIFGAYTSSQSFGEVYNIGSGRTTTVQHMLNTLRTQFPHYQSEQIQYAPARPGDIKYSGADCSKYIHFKQQIHQQQ